MVYPKIFKLVICVGIVALVLYLGRYGWMPSGSLKKHALTDAEKNTRAYLEEVVRILSEDIGVRDVASYRHLDKAKDYIASEFSGLGYHVELQYYSMEGKVFSNIIARPQGVRADNPLVIGAHYDTCSNPGADDNASGVAGMLALARLLREEKGLPIVFVAFVNEEPPFFETEDMGSRVYVRRLKDESARIRGAVILESIGYYSERLFSQRYLYFLGYFYPNRANFIALVGNFKSASLTADIKRGMAKSKKVPVRSVIVPESFSGTNYSDHWSFWKDGYPAVMVTDTAFLRNPHYHKGSDLPSTLDYDAMAVLVHSLKNSVESLLTEP
ncbi:MAG: M28 family peptidase [Candidatus Omnitrophica bacterium]|nr:M28 family peptidase [Candidatus Omnitrophota bacterium]